MAQAKDASGSVNVAYTATGSDCSSCGGSSSGRSVRVDYPTFSRLFTYDKLGRFIRETDNLGQTTNYDYEAWDNLLALTDARSRSPATHDAAGRVIAERRRRGHLRSTSSAA